MTHSLRLALVAVLVAVLMGGALEAGELLERAEASRYALVVSSGPEPSSLGSVLTELYDFETVELVNPTRKDIARAMDEIYQSVQEYDELLVHFSLPIVRGTRSYLVPSGGVLEEPWSLLDVREMIDWLNAMPSGSALVTFPSCFIRGDLSRDPLLEELSYGKRPGPVEVLLACDFEAARVSRRSPDDGYLEWAGDDVANAVADVLREAATHDHEGEVGGLAMVGKELAARVDEKLSSIEMGYVVVPYGSEPAFRFVHRGTLDEYRARYQGAGSYSELLSVLRDYLAAAGPCAPQGSGAAAADCGAGLVSLLRDIAVDPGAAAPMATLDSKEALQLSSYAVDALARMEGDVARDALRAIAGAATDNSLIRRSAVTALTQRPGPEDLEALAAAVSSEDSSVREAAVLGMVRVKHEDAAALLAGLLGAEEDLRVKTTMIQGVSGFRREQDRELFTALLEDENWAIRKEAIAALARLEPDLNSSRRIADALANDENSSVRETAASALGRTAPPGESDEVVAALTEALVQTPDPSERVQAAAASSLGRVGDREAELTLIAALTEDERFESVRTAAAVALGFRKSRAAVPALEQAADSGSPTGLRRAAVTALGAIGSPEAVEIVFSKLDDKDESVRREAERWTKRLEVDPSVLQQSAAAGSVEVRQLALSELGTRGDASSLDALIKGLGDADASVRRAATESLAKNSNPATLDRVIGALEGGDDVTRGAACAVLGQIASDDPRILEVLAAVAANDTSHRVRETAVRALGARGDEATPVVVRAMKDDSMAVRLAVVAALEEIGSVQARGYLERIAKGDESEQVRWAAARALSPSKYRRSESKNGG